MCAHLVHFWWLFEEVSIAGWKYFGMLWYFHPAIEIIAKSHQKWIREPLTNYFWIWVAHFCIIPRFPFLGGFSDFHTCRLIFSETFWTSFPFCWHGVSFCRWREMRNSYGEFSHKNATRVAATSPTFRTRTAPNVLQTNNEAVGAKGERKSTAVWRKRFHSVY